LLAIAPKATSGLTRVRTSYGWQANLRLQAISLAATAVAVIATFLLFPVDVSAIGSVADRSEIPTDRSRERSAKRSYLLRAKRVKQCRR
jgi:hypothetical protein